MSSDLQRSGSFFIPKPLNCAETKRDDLPDIDVVPQCSISSIYQANIADYCRKVTATWSKTDNIYSLIVDIENPFDDLSHYTCKIDLKPWQLWGRKGLKSFEIDEQRIDMYWDFRQVTFTTTSEPSPNYYVAISSQDEMLLLLGDLQKEAYDRTKKRPPEEEPALLCKKEHVCGKSMFCTRALLSDEGQEHDIAIEDSLLCSDDPEMWVYIDGMLVIRVVNLHWRFRGNEMVSVKNTQVQLFWDVHDWLYGSPGSNHGLFIFTPGFKELNDNYYETGDSISSLDECQTTPQFCHVLYAWKTKV